MLYFLASHIEPDGGLLRTLYLGQAPLPRAIPEILEAEVPVLNEGSYDGHFFAQIAVDPTLQREDLQRALDRPGYRARRILLPGLAWLGGLGQGVWAIHVHTWLNLIFFGAFLLWFVRRFPLDELRTWGLGCALFWSSGTLYSCWRALADFPAAVLGVWALFWIGRRRWGATGWMAAAILAKETMVLSLLAQLEPKRWRSLLLIPLAILPFALWMVYIHFFVGLAPSAGYQNFSGIPFQAFWGESRQHLEGYFSRSNIITLSFAVAPWCLLFQAIYLWARPGIHSAAWRFGLGFTVLLAFLGPSVWVDVAAYSRVLLPLTFAFNFYLYERERGGLFWVLLIPANVGLWFWPYYMRILIQGGHVWTWG